MRIVAIIQARLGSTRFPRKVLADLHGKPIYQHVCERVGQAMPSPWSVVLAMPFGDYYDDAARAIIDGAGAVGALAVFMLPGDESDVLRRFAAVAPAHRADVIVRVTCDCPLIDPRVIQRVLWLFDESDLDFASNDTRVSGYPDGWDVEVFSRDLLERADRHATDPVDREHVTPWMRRHGRCGILYAPEPWTGPKLSIDTLDDLVTVRRWMEDHPA